MRTYQGFVSAWKVNNSYSTCVFSLYETVQEMYRVFNPDHGYKDRGNGGCNGVHCVIMPDLPDEEQDHFVFELTAPEEELFDLCWDFIHDSMEKKRKTAGGIL